MNLRLLLAVTLLSSIAFHLSARTTTGQRPASAINNDSHKRLELDISSLKQQARDGDAKAQYKLGLILHDWQRSSKGPRDQTLNWTCNDGETGIRRRRAHLCWGTCMNKDWASRRTTAEAVPSAIRGAGGQGRCRPAQNSGFNV